ncbi:DUF397 domain-containing protein [Streptomyces kunmingensis]|uniref:DUF397 domain-containing protein n=1 Tax=Streptomyces kunmingensis TaxID=68225 RepID=A0ABU6CHW3_9ACTN|nr:DUF397 domain-containing protein [Streptomyces kunmingensis]MEB3964039.1 DUF397 domain-containing protein [Streptomyces kunmingensis]
MREALHWQKSTFSDGGDGNTCVEVATAAGSIRLRESDDPTTEIATAPTALSHLLQALKGPRR